MPASGPTPSKDVAEAHRQLFDLLVTAYGSKEEARSVLFRALLAARRTELPPTVPELLTFVRAGLLPVLSEDLGPRLTLSLLDDFVAQQEIRSGIRAKESKEQPVPVARVALRARASVRARRLHVLLVGTDRVALAAPARALLREGHEVTVVASLEELGQVVRSDDPVDVAVLDERQPARLVAAELLKDRFPAVALVEVPGDATSEAMLEAVRKVSPSV